MNLTEVSPSITHDTICDALITEFFKAYDTSCEVRCAKKITFSFCFVTLYSPTDRDSRYGYTTKRTDTSEIL